MTYEDFTNSLARAVTWRALLRLDYCAHTCGVSPCAAEGPPYCYYTFSTCLDPENFSKSEKVYAFARADGFAVPDSLPLLLDFQSVPTEIRPQDHVTRRARVTLDFCDDAPLALANPDRAVSNPETAGTFFRNLIARNPNSPGRIAELWQGYRGLPASDYRLVFRGVIEKMEWREGRAQLVIKDQLKMLDQKIPEKQGSDNLLTAAYNGGSTMAVTHGAEFAAPGAVKVESEYVTFTGVNNNDLTGCVPGRFGTSAVSHAAGLRVKQVAIFAEPADGAGLPPDEIFLTLLCAEAGLDPLAIGTVDRGAALSAGVTSTELTLPINPSSAFPETGIVRVDDELIRYRGVSGNSLQVVERGAYGTVNSSHSQATAVLITRFTDELGRWFSGTKYRRFVEQSIAVKDLVNDLREQCLLAVWQAEDSTIAARSAAPPLYLSPPKTLDDEHHLIDQSTSWDPGEDLRITRISVYYSPIQPDPGEDPENYAGQLVIVDALAESPESFGEVKNREVWANWICDEHEALLLASRYLSRYRSGAAGFKFALELKDDEVQVGDLVRIESRDLIDSAGQIQPAVFEVLKKQRVADNRLEFQALDARLDRRYPLIAPSTLTADYDQAGDEDRERYGFVGDAENRVGLAGEDGYYIY